MRMVHSSCSKSMTSNRRKMSRSVRLGQTEGCCVQGKPVTHLQLHKFKAAQSQLGECNLLAHLKAGTSASPTM